MKNLILVLFLLPVVLMAQDNSLAVFKSLEKYRWKAEGAWGDGSAFKQEISFQFSLDDKLVLVESLGFTNKEQTEFGLRNHGIRQYDEKLKKIRFWEFDVFGNVTEGIVESEGKNLKYSYDYEGTLVTEMWLHKNEKTYDFIVGVYENGEWKQKFLETQFIGTSK